MGKRLVKWLQSGWYVPVMALILAACVHWIVLPRLEAFVSYWYEGALGATRLAEWQRAVWGRLFLVPVGVLVCLHLLRLPTVLLGTRASEPAAAVVDVAAVTAVRSAITGHEVTQVRKAVTLEPVGPRCIGPHGKYRVEKLLGSGGMGSVHRGFDQVLQRPVAMKCLHLDAANEDGDSVARFREEALSLAALSHNHIVPVYEIFEEGSEFWMVLELLPGGDLDALIERKRPTVKQSVAIIKAIARGLEYAHNKGVVHRDIKPANILFSEEHLPKLVDFGIAKRSQSSQSSVKTQIGMSLGSPTYMSPEQAQGKQDIDLRSDIYSLGITFYKMLAGDVPFTGDDPRAVMIQHLTQTPPALVPQVQGVTSTLNAIVMKMLEKEREARYQNLGEFIADLDDYARSVSS